MAHASSALALQIVQRKDQYVIAQEEVHLRKTEEAQTMCLSPNAKLLLCLPRSTGLMLVPILALMLLMFLFDLAAMIMVTFSDLVLTVVVFLLRGTRQEHSKLLAQLHDKTSELVKQVARSAVLNNDFSSDTPHVVGIDFASTNLDTDFSFLTSDEKTEQGVVRLIKIKCPGIQRSDVVVNVMFNGCIVKIKRQSSHGTDGFEWVKKFQFKASDGLFDLKDHKVTLGGGFLTLIFEPLPIRVFRFPDTFDMSIADNDNAWLLCEDSAATAAAATTPSRDSDECSSVTRTSSADSDYFRSQLAVTTSDLCDAKACSNDGMVEAVDIGTAALTVGKSSHWQIWHATLTVGSVVELLVKRQWVRAEVVIAREKVLTMKWTDRKDGTEMLRRVARDSAEMRACR